MVFCVWHNVSRLIHVVAHIRTSCLFRAESHVIVWIEHIVFISSFVDGHLGCFHLLAVVSSAAVTSTYTYLFEYLLSAFLGIYLGVELLGHMVIRC